VTALPNGPLTKPGRAVTLSLPRRSAASGSGGPVMSAEVLRLPASIRCDHVAREMREGVIGVLNEIHRHGGDAAFHRAARDLMASVAAIVAHVEGRQRVLDVLDLIDRAFEASGVNGLSTIPAAWCPSRWGSRESGPSLRQSGAIANERD
jgi:hypothetical protein